MGCVMKSASGLSLMVADMDYENGDRFCLKAGGDGDNGELILAYLDEWFALAERGE